MPELQQPAGKQAARDVIERTWREVLDLPPGSEPGEFFDQGGTSVLAIRLLTRLNEAGLGITLLDLYNNSGIHDLVDAATSARPPGAEAPAGPSALAPMQNWFFGQRYPDVNRWTIPIALALPKGLPAGRLREALELAAERHRALGAAFPAFGTDRAPEMLTTEFDASASWLGEIWPGADPADVSRDIEAAAEAAHSAIDVTRGPVCTAFVARLAAEPYDVLVLIVHHLIADGVSMEILTETLRALLRPSSPGGQRNRNTGRTARRFPEWASALASDALADSVTADLPFWRELLSRPQGELPCDFPGGANDEGSARTKAAVLSAQATSGLLRWTSDGAIKVPDLLTAAFVKTVGQRTGQPYLHVHHLVHGRFPHPLLPDVSAALGCFIYFYPVHCDLTGASSPAQVRAAIASQQEAPSNGLGYAVLRYGHGQAGTRLAGSPEPLVGLNYLGRLPGRYRKSTSIRPVDGLALGRDRDPLGSRDPVRLHIYASLENQQLRVGLRYSTSQYREQTMTELAGSYVSNLEWLASFSES